MYQKTLKLRIKQDEFLDITGKIQEILENSKMENGLCHIFIAGSTGAIAINENESRLKQDMNKMMDNLTSWKHKHPSNANSHLKSLLLGCEKTITVQNGNLVLGTWQSVFAINFDIGERNREIIVTVL